MRRSVFHALLLGHGVFLAGLVAAGPTLAATPLYSITDLGSFGGSQSAANAINNAGQVVGSADLTNTAPAVAHAFLYSSGALTDLGVLGTYGGFSSSAAFGINSNSDIVGQSYTSNGTLHAFLYSQGQMADLGTLPGAQQSKAHAINDNGQIVGWSLPAGTQQQHAFLYENGALTDLGVLGGGPASFAFDINNHGQVVGDSWLTDSGLSDTAFIYSNGTMHALPNLGAQPAVQAFAINDYGQVTGYAGQVSTGGPSVTRGFLYADGSLTDLGDLGGQLTNVVPAALNNRGQIVGSVSAYQGATRAFFYAGGVITDLNNLIPASSGWTLTRANGINDNGQIVGSGRNAASQTHAFLLTPGIFPQISATSSNAVLLQFTAPAGSGAYVEYSDDLVSGSWQSLVVLDPVPFIHDVLLTDAFSLERPPRFYRVRTR